MFTGLVTDVGLLTAVSGKDNRRFTIECAYDMATVAMGASIACNGVCLTVVSKTSNSFTVDVSGETLSVTTLSRWEEGARVNLERSLKVGDELGGHIVSGHVDCCGTLKSLTVVEQSHKLVFAVPSKFAHLLVQKGSVAINGVSLTVNDVTDTPDATEFSVNIIPHTWEVTALSQLVEGDSVNIEFDLLARYVARMQAK